jgi:alpha-glucosidase (family GH31 glycosyl hydrolase)
MRKIFIILLLALMFSDVAESQGASDDQTVYKGENYSIKIWKSPFSFTVSNLKTDIMKVDGLILPKDMADQKIISYDLANDKLSMVLATAGNNFYNIRFAFHERTFDLFLEPADKSEKEVIGLRFSTKTSGHWYGGAVVQGHQWPLEQSSFAVDPFFGTSNQASPVWYTSAGAGIISRTYNTMGYSFNKPEQGYFNLYSKNSSSFELNVSAGNNIREAYTILSAIVGKPSVTPSKDYFAFPQYNTWIEFLSGVNQDGITRYAQEIKNNSFPYKLFIIDDKWTTFYGDPDFDPKKFQDPAKLISFLHENGFKVALWMTPFIQKSAKNYKYALDRKFLIMNPDGLEPYTATWWNGTDALVDLSNPEAYSWFLGMLREMQSKYGVDGFKLDAGDAEYLEKPFSSYGMITANNYTDLFAGLGRYFEANELRVSWLNQSMGMIERLRDKGPNWGDVDGIKSLIPHALTSSLIGFIYTCPDMIGGGLDQGFNDKGYKFDEELFVRWTQASALMPMMQYSLAPWKLSKPGTAICRKYSDLHVALGDYIYELAQQSAVDGTPIIRPLFFEFPLDERTYAVRDEFMLGERFLVAPVLEKGAVARNIYIPEGTWTDFWSGKVFRGGISVNYPAPLEVLPLFVRID